jgi:signal transduction histidine kinase
MNEARWLVIIDPGGEVIAVGGGAPRELRGKRASDLAGELAPIADANRELELDLRRGEDAAARIVRVGAADVEVVAVAVVAVSRSVVRLAAIAERAVRPFEPQADAKDVALSLVVERDVAVRADEAKTVWIISTLVGNALRFARHGTRRLPGGTIEVIVESTDTDASVIVRDDGPGIDPAHVRTLFEPSGGAVALRMARHVAIANGGDLRIESSVDADEHGTTATLVLPRVS